MNIPATTLAARIHAHGDPAAVLRVEEIPVVAPGPGEVLVRMRRAPINPADINVIEGTYGILPTLPATVGNEGVGEVVAVGGDGGGGGLVVGDVVRPVRAGSWCAWLTVPVAACEKLPAGLPVDQAAMLAVNPATAWGILEEFGPLVPGDWVVANGATSGVALALLALAKDRGLRFAGVVRRAEAVDGILARGADAVVVEGRDAGKQLKAAFAGAAPKLALNQVGGDGSATLAKVLASRGWLVTIGAMSRQPFTVGNGPLIFNELRMAGFWISRWRSRVGVEVQARMLEDLARLVRRGILALPVDRVFPLADIAAGVARAREGGRSGKVLIDLG